MKPTRSQIAWLATGLALLLLSFAAVGYGLFTLGRTPWTGMQFNPRSEPGTEVPEFMHSVPTLQPGGVTQLLLGTPADLAGIRLNDRIVMVEGIPTHDLTSLRRLSSGLKVGDSITYRVERFGNTFDVEVRLDSPLQSQGYRIGLVTGFVLAVVFAVIGLVVYLKRLQDRRARLFYVISVLVAVAYLNLSSVTTGVLSGTGVNDVQSVGPWIWLLLGVYVLSASLLGALLLHFSLIFPRERVVLGRHPGLLRWIYGVPLLHIILGFLAYLLAGLENLLPWERIAEPAFLLLFVLISILIFRSVVRSARGVGWKASLLGHPLGGMAFLLMCPFMILWTVELALRFRSTTWAYEDLLLYGVMGSFVLLIALLGLLVYPIATSVVMYRSYRESGPEERAQVRWPLWGTILSLCGVTVIALLSFALTFSHGSTAEVQAMVMDVLQKAFYLLIPISFAFAILKYRLLDIELILRRAAVYTAVTGTIVVLFVALAWGLGGLVVRFAGIESEWVIIASTLVVVGVLIPVRNRVQSIVERRFYRERIDYPQALRRIAGGVQESSDSREVAELVAGEIQQAMRSRAVVVFLKRPAGSVMRATAKIGLPDATLETLGISAGDPLLRTEGVIEVPAFVGLRDDLRRTLRKARATLLVPIRRSGELFGAIGVGSKLSGGPFDPEDREFCVAAAGHAAVSLENLFLRKRGQEVDRALEIQRHLLPEKLPGIRGCEVAASWQPSSTVGGDYYDVIRLGAGRTALCIADAAGKGMPAALLMSNLQAAVRALAPGAGSPAELCESINQVLSGSIAAESFITFFYAELDAAGRVLRYSNAGHNPPILVHGDGTVQRLATGGMVLGAFPDLEYGDDEVTLAPGDRLLLFTDGITESVGAAGEEFGEERLLAVVQGAEDIDAAEIERRVMSAVNDFGTGPLVDDATLLVVTVRPEPE